MNENEAMPPVKIKGGVDGLRLTINPALSLDELKKALTAPFERLKQMAVNAKILIDTGGIETPDLDERIDQIGDFLKTEFQVGQVGRIAPPSRSQVREHVLQKDMENAFQHYDAEGLVIAGRIRSGQKVQAKKHLIVLGDVNPGAEAIAGGDIIVMGSLQGRASAGQPDNINAIIVALELKPTQIQIGGLVAVGAPDAVKNGPEFACVENNAIVVDDYIRENPFKRLACPEVR